MRFTEHRETEGEAYYREACRRGWEGVIAKNGGSEYVSRRTRDWLKFKCTREQELVIGGYTDPQGKRIGFGALLVGYYDRGKLMYAGKVGTGYDHASLQRLGRQLARLETATFPFAGDGLPRCGVHWVKPKLVAQIGFTEWAPGGKLWHSRFLGLREDKRPEPVSVPLDWSEIGRKDLRSDEVTIRTVFDWLGKVGDAWTDFWRRGVSLSRVRAKLEKFDGTRRVPQEEELH